MSDLQTRLDPYLQLVGDKPWLQALVVIASAILLAWIFDRFISASLRNLAQRTSFSIDDHLIDHLHSPIMISMVLLGLALAVNLLKISAPFDFICFSIIKTVAFIVWAVFLLRVIRSVLRHVALNEERVSVPIGRPMNGQS